MDRYVSLTANNEENFFTVSLPATNTFAPLTRAFVYFMILTYISTNHKLEIMKKKLSSLLFYISMIPSFLLTHPQTLLTFVHSFNCFQAWIFHHSWGFIARSFWLAYLVLRINIFYLNLVKISIISRFNPIKRSFIKSRDSTVYCSNLVAI